MQVGMGQAMLPATQQKAAAGYDSTRPLPGIGRSLILTLPVDRVPHGTLMLVYKKVYKT
jgi:hypothetical protein